MHDRWIPDEDWVRIIRKQPEAFKLTPGDLNKAISKKLDFMNDKYEDRTSQRMIFHNKRRIITNVKEKTNRNIWFYCVLPKDRIGRPEFSKEKEFWQDIWEDPE
jgi:hypothetical protein